MGKTLEEPRPSLQEAMVAADAAEMAVTARVFSPAAPNPQAALEEAAFCRRLRLPLVQAYLDMRADATGHRDLDESAILELDMLRQVTERARAGR